MKKFFVLMLVVAVSFVLALPAFAVPSGKTLEFEDGAMGKVIFDGKVHADHGLKCADCHQSGLFKMKKGADKITMKDINEGKFCGTCHKEGGKAFPAKECAKCHKK
jgi:c(7)-type cytochrome triheme protein